MGSRVSDDWFTRCLSSYRWAQVWWRGKNALGFPGYQLAFDFFLKNMILCNSVMTKLVFIIINNNLADEPKLEMHNVCSYISWSSAQREFTQFGHLVLTTTFPPMPWLLTVTPSHWLCLLSLSHLTEREHRVNCQSWRLLYCIVFWLQANRTLLFIHFTY